MTASERSTTVDQSHTGSIKMTISCLPERKARYPCQKPLDDESGSIHRKSHFSSPANDTHMTVPPERVDLYLRWLWMQVLDIPSDVLNADDNFFDLGGDSVTAIQLVSIARKQGLLLAVADVFHHPTLVELSTRLQIVSESPGEFVAPFSQLGQGCSLDVVLGLAVEQCHVHHGQIADIYPCTPLQEGLMSLTAKRAGAYIKHFSYRLPQNIDPDRLRTAWNVVARFNPILNTRIIQSDVLGSLQVVVSGDMPWTTHDSEDAYQANTQVAASFKTGEPLVHAAVVRNGTDSSPSRFILSMHHAIYDAWTLPLLLEQAETAFQGQQLLHRPFGPFLRHLSESRSAAEIFWQTEFTDVDIISYPVLPSPSYVPIPIESLSHTIQLPDGPTGGFTLSTKLRLAWAITLSQHSNTQDVVFGMTVNGRSAPVAGIEQMTGPTIATIPFYIRLNQCDTVTQALQDIQNHSTRLLPHEHLGLQNIRRLGSCAAAACQFQNLLVIQTRRNDSRSGRIFVEQDRVANRGARYSYALTLLCEVSPNLITVETMYDPQVIGKISVQQILFQLGHVMGQINGSDSDMKVKALGGPSPDDYRHLRQWNEIVPERVNHCVHEVIQDQCRFRPSALAVCAWDGELRYGKLDTLSSGLAARLVVQGVGPDIIVPLCFEKSRWAIVAMLGVMKAGGAFVLLDPSHPIVRLEEICRAVSAPLIVTSVRHAKMMRELAGHVIVVKDEHHDRERCQPPSQVVSSSARPKNATYVVFTSGSTGTPKGVVITHEAFCSSLFSWLPFCHLTSQTRLLQVTSYAFDVSIGEILGTFVAGGCVCIPSDSAQHHNLSHAMNEYCADLVMLTPSVLKILEPGDLKSLKAVVLAGETISPSLLEQWSSHVHITIAYGPAECSVFSTIQPSADCDSDARDIGWAAGCVSWITHPQNHDQLLPIGGVGELLIEGPSVGRGYLNDPAKTAAAFIDPPTWLRQFRGDTATGQLYKTGDLVQYAADGSLRFVGRKDTQVKLRGQRIELGEVEHHVRQCFETAHEVVAEVVTPVEAGRVPLLMAFICSGHGTIACNGAGDEELVLEPSDDHRQAALAAETRLAGRIPAYMIPAVFLAVKRIPLTRTGKTDRRRLREYGASLPQGQLEAYMGGEIAKQMPSTARERTLQQIWARVLHLSPDNIGVQDNFFRLGGDSITAMQMVALARSAGLDVSVPDVLRRPCLGELCGSGCEEQS